MGVARPLVVTMDPALLDAVLRLAALAGTEVDAVPDHGAARALWQAAPVIVLGADAARRPHTRLPRRSGVFLVGTDLDDAEIWELGVYAGAEQVAILPDAEAWLTDVLAGAADPPSGPAPLIACIGGRGGAGATTLAVALAIAAAREGLRPLLLDADPLGGGIDLALGGEGASGLRWDAFGNARGRLSATALSDALPLIEDVTVLTWHRAREPAMASPAVAPAAIAAAVDAARRGFDLVVADLPRALDTPYRLLAEEASLVLLVVPCELRSAAAAAQVARQLKNCGDVRVVARGPSPGGLDGWLLAETLQLPLAGSLRPEPGLSAGYEQGVVPGARGKGPLAALAAEIVDEFHADGRRVVA